MLPCEILEEAKYLHTFDFPPERHLIAIGPEDDEDDEEEYE
jgi:hypothetical protein